MDTGHDQAIRVEALVSNFFYLTTLYRLMAHIRVQIMYK